MRALPLALAAAAATSFLELLPEPSMVCDNSKCLLESEDSCLREYAIDRDCSTFGDAYLVLDDALAACARHENCSGVYDPRCDGMPAESCRKDKCEHNHCWAHNYHREPICAEGYSPMPNSSHDHDWYPFACCPAGTGGGFFMCDANEALADHPASDLHDTRGCVVTCAAWNVSDCAAPTYVGAVADRRCEETVRLDKIGAGRYENFGHHSYWHGGNHTMDFMDCVAAVRAHAGQDGCRGEFFYWEDWGGRGGNCRCVTGNCTEARREWDWQLFSLGCPGAAEEDGGICTHTALYYDGSQDLSAHDPDKCREHVCEHHDRDCCGYDHETWCADGYTLVRGNEGPPWGCWPGRKGYRCLPSDAFLGRFVEPYDFEGCPAGYYTCAGCCDQDADCACDGLGGDAYEHDWRTPKCPEGYYECDGCCDRDADCACDDACDLGSHEDCSLAYHENVSQPAGWCPVGYHDCDHHDCCDFNVDCECVSVRHGSGDEYCGPGPTGSDGALPNFECSVRKHGEEASGEAEVALEDRWEHHNYDAGGCCAGPNETAACADGYTVVAGDAPCVFTCCEGAVDNLTTAADVDAEGFCWEAHADEGRRPPLVGECCDDETDACPGGEQKVYVKSHREQGETYETHCCPRASAPAACFERKRRADCVEDACRTFKPGGPAILDNPHQDHWVDMSYKDVCFTSSSHWERWGDHGSHWSEGMRPPPAARYCADNHTLAGVDYVGGVGTCCTNKSSDDAKCVAPVPDCFHHSGPRRCDILLKYFGAEQSPHSWNDVRNRPCRFRGEPYACDDLRCDPASGALYYTRSDSWRWWDLSDWHDWRPWDSCERQWWRRDVTGTSWPDSSRNRRMGERQRIRACGVVTEDGDFFHAQLRERKRWDEAWRWRRDWYSSDYHERWEDRWFDHPWTNFWVSTRAPRHFAGLDAEPTTAAADACARDVEKEFYSGCLGTCGKTCGELGHDPVLFEKLRAAVKKWPDGGGGEAIPDVCAFRPKFAWDQDGLWITVLYVLAWLGLLVIYVVGVAAACCVSQPSCVGYARLQKLRNWAHEGEGGCARRCVFWCCGGWIFAYMELSLRRPALLGVTIVSVVVPSTLAGLWIVYELGAFLLFVALFFGGNLFILRNEVRAGCQKLSWPALFCVTVVPLALAATLAGLWIFDDVDEDGVDGDKLGVLLLFVGLFFGGLLYIFREKVRARYEKFSERRPWFGRRVAPILEKLSAGVASLKKKLSAGAAAVARPLRSCLARCRGSLARYCCCWWDSLRRCLVKRPPAAVYTAEDGTEQTVPWVVAPGPPGTIVTRPDGIKVKVPEGVQRGQLFSLAEAAPAGDGAAAPKHAAEPPSLVERTALLARKAWTVKKRTTGALAKQVIVPLLGVGLLWLLYDTREENRLARSIVASDTSATSAPTAVTKTRKRTTFDTNHGDFELTLFQLFFFPWVQVVASALVADVAQGTREATRAAGGADAAYWLASFFIEGVALGGGVAVAIAAGAAPGLFRRAGKSFEVAAFLELFALHWFFLLALVLQTFVVVTCLLRSQIAAAGLPPLLHAALHGCYLLWAPLRTWNVGKRRYKTNWRLRARPRAHFASALLPQFAYDLLVDSFSPTKKRAGWRCQLVADGFVGERYPCEMCRKECWEKAPRPRLEAFEQYLQSQSLTAAPCADEHLMCEDVWPFWYEKTEDRGWRPESSWTAGVYCMLMVSVALWAAVLWYVIQVSTSAARGKGKDLLFCLRKAYWRPPPPDEVVEKAPLVNHDEWFENDESADAPVQVRGLRKVFGKKVAVSDATFAIRDSEIFCLLGHNGAGKTTTMSMITGAMAPDGGSASFFGIRTLGPLADADGLDRLRQLLGFCPQHDALFPRLTLREHLIFYSRLKGVEESRAENEASGLLELFRLTEMAEGFPLKLSGGQKRKVMMAAALTGGSRLVVLDEPTAGMDPVARREVWTLLRDVRVDRSVLLTTHHMEEAEALADRVAIMAAGSVKCCGTLSFLKRRFGGGGDAADGADTSDTSIGGLHVAVTTAAAARDQLKAVFAQHMPKAKLAAASKLEEDLRRATEKDAANPLLGSTPKSFSSSFKSPLLNATRGSSFSASRNWADGAEAPLLEDSARDVTTTYTIHASRSRVAALFEGLEAEADGLGLVDVSVTATSLEDVFISVGEQVEGAAAPVEAETLVGGALLPSAPGEPVPAGRLVAAVVQFRLPAVQTDQSDLDSPLDSHTGSSK